MPLPSPDQALAALAGCDRPLLIGVRHHSPALAAAVPALLDAFAPERVLVELPVELEPWLPWVGHPDCIAPIALSATRTDGQGLAFYPFADFSPELAAIRWATARGVPIEAIDLPVARRDEDPGDIPATEPVSLRGRLFRALCASTGASDGADLWDRLVEAHAPGSSAEEVRRAGLLYGWALRADTAHGSAADARDLVRERYMRERLAGGRAAAVIGSFHAAALADPAIDPLPRLPLVKRRKKKEPEVQTALLPYSFELLDARSGYPAGIRDPLWQQRVWRAAAEGSPIDRAAAEALIAVCRHIRAARHPAGVPDAQEALRLALDLASLRGLPGPGRAELLEAIEATLGHGEAQGRGRIVARALTDVLVGRERGRLAKGTPRSGLGPHVEDLLAALRLPAPGVRSRRAEVVTLDPLRSDIDRRRHVALHRLSAAGVTYAEPFSGEDRLGQAWEIRWTPRTDADLELASARGTTLEQVAEGTMRLRIADLRAVDRWSPTIHLDVLEVAAECGLGGIATKLLQDLGGPEFQRDASLGDIVRALTLGERIRHGHVPGLPIEGSSPKAPGAVRAFVFPPEFPREDLLASGVRALEGLAGSDDLGDARALIELVRLLQGTDLGDGRLGWALDHLAESGSPLIQGAAGVARVLADREPAEAFGVRLASWVDAEASATLARRIAGVLVVAGPAFEAHPGLYLPLMARIESLADADFLSRLPGLRDGFDVLSPAARDRLLEVLDERLPGHGARDALSEPAERLAAYAEADRAAADALRRLGLSPPKLADARVEEETPEIDVHPEHRIPAGARWRLILGRAKEELDPEIAVYAEALDELYGTGEGEGSHGDLAGDEPPFPTARDWSLTLETLFGDRVRQEVLGRAAARGRADVLDALDVDSVVPSVELLQKILALKGAVPEGELGPLRRVVARIVEGLVRDLADTVRPALGGLDLPRPTRRRSPRLDLRRTLAASLRSARPRAEGGVTIVPDRLVFRSRARRSLDWHVVLCVDVSGSMEASVLHSAMMAAILAALPALDVRFYAFSDDVVDLSDQVEDPLGLLLGVAVGGGTSIAKVLRHARQHIHVPARTMLVLVSDFEEGHSVPAVLAEVRALVESGVTTLGLAALDAEARPRFVLSVAEAIADAGMPVAALTPLELARWVAERIR